MPTLIDLPTVSPLSFDQPPARFAAVRSALEGAGYTVQGIGRTLGIAGFFATSTCDRAQLVERTRGGRPLDTLIRLFLGDAVIPRDAFAEAIAPSAVEDWLALGLVTESPVGIARTVEIAPFGDLFMAYDALAAPHESPRPESVLNISGSSQTLGMMTVRRPVQRALDLGTGCGIQAFLATWHAAEVVATDCNPRAVDFARFNAALNGLTNIDFRVGDGFAPVAGERFDLIVANPPFCLSPDRKYVYRDSGGRGDAFVRDLIRAAAGRLNEGGTAQFVCDWAHLTGGDWRDRLATWFDGLGCDALVLRDHTDDPAAYISMWIQSCERLRGAAYRQRFETWLDYFAAEGITAVSFGMITLQRRSGSNWTRIEDAPTTKQPPWGDSIYRLMLAETHARSLVDRAAWLASRWRYSPDVGMQQRLIPEAATWGVREARILLRRGLVHEGRLDRVMLALVPLLDGARPLGEILAEVAALAGVPFDQIVPAALESIRGLAARGFIWPAEWEASAVSFDRSATGI